MRASSRLVHAVSVVNSVLFLAGLGLAFDHTMATALTRLTEDPHWSTAAGPVLVVDYTSETAWQEANQHAVEAWSTAADGTPLRLAWTAGSGPCAPEEGRIVLCGASSDSLDDGSPLLRQGVARVELGTDRTQAHVGEAILFECLDCDLGEHRRRVVATHELGHALGLTHSQRPDSVMYHTGGPEHPDAIDAEGLRALYGHVDEPESCGVFDAKLGALCF